jgi:hypothetical protein
MGYVVTTVPFGMSLLAKTPLPLISDGATPTHGLSQTRSCAQNLHGRHMLKSLSCAVNVVAVGCWGWYCWVDVVSGLLGCCGC